MRLLIIDNYDSFTYNLAQLFLEFDIEVLVYRNDEIRIKEIEELKPHWITLSPGPCTPAQSGISKEVVRHFGDTIPILGVCLGMQVINEVFGGETVKAPLPIHGKRSKIHHTGEGIFSGIPSPFFAARYHSLKILIRSPDLIPLAHSEDDVIMGIKHRHLPIYGVQFHPESFLSEYGLELVYNFLRLQPDWKVKKPSPLEDPDRFPRLGWGKEKPPFKKTEGEL